MGKKKGQIMVFHKKMNFNFPGTTFSKAMPWKAPVDLLSPGVLRGWMPCKKEKSGQ